MEAVEVAEGTTSVFMSSGIPIIVAVVMIILLIVVLIAIIRK